MANQTEILNMALLRFGESRITDINQNVPAAIALKTVWDTARRATLRAGMWNFAMKQAVLTADPVPPLIRWDYAYPLPSDYIRLVQLNGIFSGTRHMYFEVQGQNLLTSQTEAKIVYVSDVTEPELFDDTFVDALAWKLAEMVAPNLMGEPGQATVLLAQGKFQAILTAMGADAIESKPPVVNALQGSSYLAARFSSAPWDFPYCWTGDPPPVQYGVSFNPYNVVP